MLRDEGPGQADGPGSQTDWHGVGVGLYEQEQGKEIARDETGER